MAVTIVPPAFDPSTLRQRTGVTETSRDSGNVTVETADIHRCRAACGRAVPQLAVIIVPPAFDPSTLRQRTGVIAASRDSYHATAEAADIHRRSAPCCRAIPQLAGTIVPPAFDPSTLRQRTGVIAASRDGGGISTQGFHHLVLSALIAVPNILDERDRAIIFRSRLGLMLHLGIDSCT